jgi:hypothetical protein
MSNNIENMKFQTILKYKNKIYIRKVKMGISIKLCMLINLLLIVTSVKSANCFYDNTLQYIYTIPDYTGNYTNGKEYWLLNGVTCDFILT